jgi:hypothetical protein
VNMVVNFVFIYENGRMKLAEIVLRRWGLGRGRMMEKVKLAKTYCKHVCKYHNICIPCTSIIC